MTDQVLTKSGVVVISRTSGHTVIAKGSPLRRLNYFDGKFLRAADLKLEQLALLNQVRLSNQAGGSGVVHGYNCFLISGDRLRVTGGLAIDPLGRLLHLTDEIDVAITELIEKSRSQAAASKAAQPFAEFAATFDYCEVRAEEPPGEVLEDKSLYLITVSHTEAFCGEEDVYGKLCEEACITSTERPYIIEGVVIRVVPLTLSVFLAASNKIALSNAHLRSRVASAYFEQERQSPASLISGEGLASNIWCLGAEAESGSEVPIAVMARSGDSTLFLDAWIAKRERMETPPRRYWAGRMAMRPWNVFLAQVLQFQCQLTTCFKDGIDKVLVFDPCLEERKLAARASETMKVVLNQYQTISKRLAESEAIAAGPAVFEFADMKSLQKDLADIARVAVTNRYLINCGIIELPSAGYLPVTSGEALTVNEQVRRLMGEGVDLRFCVVRPDYVPHALEEAQHMERISLLEGIDDPSRKPAVDVLVPDGQIETYVEQAPGTGYEMDLEILQPGIISSLATISAARESDQQILKASALRMTTDSRFSAAIGSFDKIRTQYGVRGAARSEDLVSGGCAFYYAAQTPDKPILRQSFGLASDLSLAKDSLDSVNLLRSSMLDRAAAVEDTGSEDTDTPIGERAAAATHASFADNVRFAKSTANYQRLSSGLRINVNSRQPLLALWVAMQSDEDPFELQRGASTQVTAKTVLVISYETENKLILIAEEVSANGQLYIDDIDQRGAEVRLACRFKADGVISTFRDIAGQRTEQSYPLRLNEQVYMVKDRAGGPRPTVRVSVSNPSIWRKLGNIELRYERVWKDATTAEVNAAIVHLSSFGKTTDASAGKTQPDNSGSVGNIRFERAGSFAMAAMVPARQVIPIFSGQQKVNNDVLNPGHALHSASLSAIARIRAALDDKGFADFAARQLFPPPKPVPDELKVYARRNWVLFHRRRSSTCDFEKLLVAVVQPRRFRVFHAVVASDDDLILLRDAIMDNRADIISRFDPKPVTLVDFEAGIPSVRTSHADVRFDWRMQVAVDADIALGMVASRGAAFDEGQPLAEARLNSLVDVIGPVAELIEDVQLLWAPQIPDVLAHGEVDGIFVFATQGIATVCHEVHRVEVEVERFGNFAKAFEAGNFRDVLQEYGAEELDYTPKFRSETENLFGETAATDLITAWGDKGDREPVRVLTLLQQDAEGNLPTDQPYADQALTIAATLDATIDQPNVVGVSQSLLKCPAVTILVTEPLAPPGFNEVFGYVFPSKPSDELPGALKTAHETNGLHENFPESPGRGTTWYPLGTVEFDTDNVADIPSLNVMVGQTISNGLLDSKGLPLPNLVYYVFSLSKQGADTDQVARDKAQAERIRNSLGLVGNVTDAVHGVARWPSEGTAMTLVLIPTGQYMVGIIHGNLYANAADVAEADVVTSVSEKISYDTDGDLIKDLALEAAVARLKKEGTVLKNIELVTIEPPAEGATDPKAEALLAAFKEAGVAKKRAKVKLRVATDAERELISRMGTGVVSGLVFRK